MTARHRLISLLLLCWALSSCLSPSLPRGMREEVQPTAESPDGRLLADGRDGLILVDKASARRERLAVETPAALAWRRDGGQLAAVLPGRGTMAQQLVVFDQDGKRRNVLELSGHVVALNWSARHDLLVAGYRWQAFSFGANLSQWLLRISETAVERITLGDVTVEPGTARRFAPLLSGLLPVAFSPAGDELVYLRLHDPPQSPAYLQLLHRNWQVPGERKLLDLLPVRPTAVEWTAASDAIVCRSEEMLSSQVVVWPAPDSEPLAASRSDTTFIHNDDRLWLMRKWRFEGLITPEEFQMVIDEAKP